MKWLQSLTIMAAALAATVAPAAADVIYTFEQNGPTAAGSTEFGIRTSFQMVVSDEAAARGFSFEIQRQGPNQPLPQIDGLLSLHLTVTNEIDWDLADFVREHDRQPYYQHTLSLTAAAGGLLSGEVYGNNTLTDTRLLFDGRKAVLGTINSDAYNQYCSNDACTFSGTQTRTVMPVPEPMSIALFGVGIAGLGVVRRARARA